MWNSIKNLFTGSTKEKENKETQLQLLQELESYKKETEQYKIKFEAVVKEIRKLRHKTENQDEEIHRFRINEQQQLTKEIEDKEDGEEDVEFEWEELLGEHEDYENSPTDYNEDKKPDIPIISIASFSELYLQQLQDSNATAQEMTIAEEILGNLDTQGYLTIEPLLISDRLELEEQDVLTVMYKIQRLDPPGVAARNIQECLLAQAEYRDEDSLAIEILREHFDDFTNHRYEIILENSGCSKEELNESMEFIARLNPSPRDDQLPLAKFD